MPAKYYSVEIVQHWFRLDSDVFSWEFNVCPDLINLWVSVTKIVQLRAKVVPESWSTSSNLLSDVCAVITIVGEDFCVKSLLIISMSKSPGGGDPDCHESWPCESTIIR